MHLDRQGQRRAFCGEQGTEGDFNMVRRSGQFHRGVNPGQFVFENRFAACSKRFFEETGAFDFGAVDETAQPARYFLRCRRECFAIFSGDDFKGHSFFDFLQTRLQDLGFFDRHRLLPIVSEPLSVVA